MRLGKDSSVSLSSFGFRDGDNISASRLSAVLILLSSTAGIRLVKDGLLELVNDLSKASPALALAFSSVFANIEFTRDVRIRSDGGPKVKLESKLVLDTNSCAAASASLTTASSVDILASFSSSPRNSPPMSGNALGSGLL